MVSTSASGTGCVAQTWAWATSPTRLALAALLTVPLPLHANDAVLDPATHTEASQASLTVRFAGLRSGKGMVRACVTRDPQFFPSCEKDPHALKESVTAGPDAQINFGKVPKGDYAVSVLHDENSNDRADMLLGIPREGVGFSQNPRIRFGPPKFDAARLRIGKNDITTEVRLQYFL